MTAIKLNLEQLLIIEKILNDILLCLLFERGSGLTQKRLSCGKLWYEGGAELSKVR